MKSDDRGAIPFRIAGNDMEFVPTFSSLMKAETALNGGVIGFYRRAVSNNDIVLTEVAKIVASCSVPAYGTEYPDGWGVDFVGQAMLDEGFGDYVALVIRGLSIAITAKSQLKKIAQTKDDDAPNA